MSGDLEVWEILRPRKPGQLDFRIDLVNTKLNLVDNDVARRYMLHQVDERYPVSGVFEVLESWNVY